jgi:hypothetical protein
MTGMGVWPGGAFSIIPGSTPLGGQITPLDSESRSLSGTRSVVPPGRGGCTTSGGQSRWVDGGVGPWAYKGEVEIAASIAVATAALFKLCMVLRGWLCFCERTTKTLDSADEQRWPNSAASKPARGPLPARNNARAMQARSRRYMAGSNGRPSNRSTSSTFTLAEPGRASTVWQVVHRCSSWSRSTTQSPGGRSYSMMTRVFICFLFDPAPCHWGWWWGEGKEPGALVDAPKLTPNPKFSSRLNKKFSQPSCQQPQGGSTAVTRLYAT